MSALFSTEDKPLLSVRMSPALCYKLLS